MYHRGLHGEDRQPFLKSNSLRLCTERHWGEYSVYLEGSGGHRARGSSSLPFTTGVWTRCETEWATPTCPKLEQRGVLAARLSGYKAGKAADWGKPSPRCLNCSCPIIQHRGNRQGSQSHSELNHFFTGEREGKSTLLEVVFHILFLWFTGK